jgi:hypothetical protein
VEQRLTVVPLTLVPTKHEQLRDINVRRWTLGWKRQLIPAVLVLTDFVLALLIWRTSLEFGVTACYRR